MVEPEKLAGSVNALSGKAQVFTVGKTDTSALAYRFLRLSPDSNSITPVKFDISSTEAFVDLNRSFFEMKLKFLQADDNAVANDVNLYPTPGVCHTMIKQFSAHFNGTWLTPNSDRYAYGWYINQLLNYNEAEGDTILRPEGWFGVSKKYGYSALDFPVPLEGLSEAQKASIVLSQKAQEQFHNKVPGVFLFKPHNEIF